MTTRTDRGTAAAPLLARPRMLTLVFRGYVGTAVLNLAVGGWTLAFIPSALDQLRAQGQPIAPAGVVLAFALIAVGTIAYSTVIVVLAVRLRRGRSWARPALLTFSLLSLIGLVTSGTPGGAVLLLLLVFGFLATRRPISRWLTSAKGLPSTQR